jgi:cytidine deaminase
MQPEFTPDEQKLVDYAKAAVVHYNQMRHAKGGVDTLYAFLMSGSGQIHDGASFEPNLSHATVCAERQAVANMVLQESYQARIKIIVIADPVPDVQERGTPPCGTCRHLIWSFGYPDTSVILMQYIQGKTGWTFPKLEKHTAADFYPLPYEPKEGLWDNWEPK